MTEDDARHVLELYSIIRQLDSNIERAKTAHTIKIEALIDGMGARCVKLELAENATVVREILIQELQALRKLRCEGLRRLGFEEPRLTLEARGSGK